MLHEAYYQGELGTVIFAHTISLLFSRTSEGTRER